MLPKHIAISLEKQITAWAAGTGRAVADAYSSRYLIIEEIIKTQIRLGIPIVTIFLLRQEEDIPDIDSVLTSIAEIFEKLSGSLIKDNQVRVSVFGKWYDLPDRHVGKIRALVAETETFDRFFLNFCLYYDGKEEIVDACRLIAMKVKAGKIDPGAIGEDLITENLYTSFFQAPDLFIINGSRTLGGFMPWAITETRIYFTGKDWPEFNAMEMMKAIDLFRLVGNKKQ